MKAVILAGGEGQRLLPYTASLPKPMMPIGNRPILEVIVRQLRELQIEEVLLATGYLEELSSHLLWRWQPVWNSHSLFARGYAARHGRSAQSGAPVPDGAIHSDQWRYPDRPGFSHLVEFHRTQTNDVTLALASRRQHVDFGVVRLDGEGQFDVWDEKPTLEYLVSTGIYVMTPKVLTLLPDNTFLNLPEYITSLKKSGARIGGYVHKGYWLDIGRREDYEQACRDAESLCLW